MENLDNGLQHLNRAIPKINEVQNWEAIKNKLEQPQPIVLSFRQIKTATVAATVLILLNIGSWTFFAKQYKNEHKEPTTKENYLQTYDFNLYQ